MVSFKKRLPWNRWCSLIFDPRKSRPAHTKGLSCIDLFYRLERKIQLLCFWTLSQLWWCWIPSTPLQRSRSEGFITWLLSKSDQIQYRLRPGFLDPSFNGIWGTNNNLLSGTVLCIVRFWVASLASMLDPISILQLWQPRMSSGIDRCPPRILF